MSYMIIRQVPDFYLHSVFLLVHWKKKKGLSIYETRTDVLYSSSALYIQASARSGPRACKTCYGLTMAS